MTSSTYQVGVTQFFKLFYPAGQQQIGRPLCCQHFGAEGQVGGGRFPPQSFLLVQHQRQEIVSVLSLLRPLLFEILPLVFQQTTKKTRVFCEQL